MSKLKLVCLAGVSALWAADASALVITNRYTDRTLFEAATLTSVVEDFEDETPFFFSDSTIYGFSGFSVNASLNGDYVAVRPTSGDFAPLDSGAQFMFWGQSPNGEIGGNGSQGPDFTVVFDAPITSFGFDWSDEDPTDSYRIVVDGVIANFDGLQSSAPWPTSPGETRGFFGFTTDVAFTTLAIISSDQGGIVDDMGWDNLTFSATSAAVPLPAALPMLGAALGVFGLVRRRR